MVAALENTLNSTRFISSVSSVNSSFTRRSGLSEPYLNIASAYVMVGNTGRSMSAALRNTLRIMPSNISRISSSARKEVSMSICVNSGWRSARRSSSRKHFTIW